jgi:ribosomal protein S18 acetylase RimI-like enzyme
MAEPTEDEALRDMAANRGCRLVKSRRRKPGGDYGRYGLADPKSGKKLFGFGKDGLEASADEIEDFLRGRTLSTWKGSLAAAGKGSKRAGAKPPPPAEDARAAPRPQSARARAAKPEVARRASPPPLRIREADSVDAEAIARLLAELGYDARPDDVAERIARLARLGEPVLLARRGDETLGCLTWHVTPNIHRPYPVGRITMLVVTASARRHGIGRALMRAAEERLIARGCGLVEVTSNAKLRAAHAFYRRLGFERTSYRFARAIEK